MFADPGRVSHMCPTSLASRIHDIWRPRRVSASAFLLALLLAAVASPVVAKPILTNGIASPRTGTTATTFTFSVTASGGPNMVSARLTRPGAAIMVHLNGPADGNGLWTGSSKVATPGTWSVTFVATQNASLPGGTIMVTPAPTPTPRPTAKPPAATPLPIVTPRPATPAATPASTPSASSSPTPAATLPLIGGAVEPPPTPDAAGTAGGASGNEPGGPSLLLVMVLGLFVILGVGGIALLGERRMAEERPVSAGSDALPHGGEPMAPTQPEPPPARASPSEFAARVNARPGENNAAARPRRAWEAAAALDDEPIGTVDQIFIDAQPRPWDAEAPRPEPPVDETDDGEET
jgi:hypothetical protein